MKMYKVMVNGTKVMRVPAETEEGAKVEAVRQLSRPGRYGILRQWEAGGKVVEVCGYGNL